MTATPLALSHSRNVRDAPGISPLRERGVQRSPFNPALRACFVLMRCGPPSMNNVHPEMRPAPSSAWQKWV
jgi:hypothetical protein